MVAYPVVAGPERCVDFVFGQFSRRGERCDIRSAAAEDPDSPDHGSLAVQGHLFLLQESNHLAAIEVSGQRENIATCTSHLVQHFARLDGAAEVGDVARDNHQIRVPHYLAHPGKVARRHVDIAE